MLNRVLSPFGIGITRRAKRDREFEKRYQNQLTFVRSQLTGTIISEYPLNDAGEHPESYEDFECAFAAKHLGAHAPQQVLDIGSYRQFVLGMLAHYPVTTVDVRARAQISNNETVVTGDAKALELPDSSYDAVVSLCALEHFGLGRYGDELDLQADHKAIAEMKRVLRPGGVLILSTAITDLGPSIAFNAHRIYTHSQIKEMLLPLVMVDERVFSMQEGAESENVTRIPSAWDVYCGCWRKVD